MERIIIICLIFSLQIFSLSAKEIRLLTLNVLNSVEHGGWNEYNWSKNDGKTRGQKVVEVILKSEADVICVQEYLHNNEWLKDELERTTGENGISVYCQGIVQLSQSFRFYLMGTCF